ncbi:RISC-loading complex subunit TARBP2 [Pelobates cultripes]|uniref:RISC-loading complex subunit TARBP2 n=1 Tax=Pelobates cultripes TaxID=61616 RepID=A0AAD1QZ27_PELCU|nr:RISC-loading complex subunit TARBP2 [Pelobates cultripes]
MSENEECGNQTSSGCPSLEQMLALSPGKTPINLLQEYGTRIGKTPVYNLLKAEGQAHQPNFTFRVSVGDINCTGQSPGSSSLRGEMPVSRIHCAVYMVSILSWRDFPSSDSNFTAFTE